MKHTELGLPMYYAIATIKGNAPLWREAIEEFSKIHNERWDGNGSYYYGYDGRSCDWNGTNCYDDVSKFAQEVTILTPEEFLNIVNKKTTMQKLTITIDQLLKIHDIACVTWKPKISKYMARMDNSKNVTFTQNEVDEMFSAATTVQLPVLKEIFGEKKVAIDWDRIKTGSKVMIKHTEQHCDGIERINLSKPVDVIFFKTPHLIIHPGKFMEKGANPSYCTFHQDGKFVLFAADVNTDYITEVIEY